MKLQKGDLYRWKGTDDDYFIILGRKKGETEGYRYLTLDTSEENWHYQEFILSKAEKIA